ncbi:hypothetical protein QN277_008122 [Acacia crassicarpa]|uniref:Uncharacterized protein n=1 Tax=Acacia crassicarpa TaxID=499986 RepID=A0AAE1IRJ9_9FABA|nr:hypothetical protein QN277_008122 [Acacia crassicarpa]
MNIATRIAAQAPPLLCARPVPISFGGALSLYLCLCRFVESCSFAIIHLSLKYWLKKPSFCGIPLHSKIFIEHRT